MERDLRGCKHQPVSVCDVCKAERIRDAAPEMLEALRDLVTPLRHGWKVSDMQDRIDRATALLSRLDGQE